MYVTNIHKCKQKAVALESFATVWLRDSERGEIIMILYCMHFDHLTARTRRGYKEKYFTLKVLPSQQHHEIVGIFIEPRIYQRTNWRNKK